MKAYLEQLNLDSLDSQQRSFINAADNHPDALISVHPHWHQEVEILFVLEGSSMQIVGDKLCSLRKGDIVLIRSLEIHATYSSADAHTEIFVLQFHPKMVSSWEHTQAVYGQFRYGTAVPCPITPEMDHYAAFHRVLSHLYEEYKNPLPQSAVMQLAGLLALLGLSVRCFSTADSNPVATDRFKRSLTRAFDYIDKHYTSSISLEEAAEISRYSVPQFCRLFRSAVGMSFVEYLNFYRIRIAAERLRTLDATVTQIAQDCGFNSLQHFGRVFKDHMGCTPSAYMKNQAPL